MNGLIAEANPAWRPARKELVSLLQAEDFSKYYRLADEVTREYHGDEVCLRAIIEFSNYCIRECKYCGLNAHNRSLIRYRMGDREIEYWQNLHMMQGILRWYCRREKIPNLLQNESPE